MDILEVMLTFILAIGPGADIDSVELDTIT